MMDQEQPQYSIVEYMSDHSGYKCGYCKSTDTNFSHGMWAHRLSVVDYQLLINRGWRRSGKYCYKPTMMKTCCPHYVIKCDATNFKLSKSQKKVLKRMHKFLSFGKTDAQEAKDFQNESDQASGCDNVQEIIEHKIVTEEKCLKSSNNGEVNNDEMEEVSEPSHLDAPMPNPTVKACQGQDILKPPCKKAKLLRKERRETKLASKEHQPATVTKPKAKNAEKSLEDFLNEPLPDNPAHRLEVRIVRSSPPSPEYDSNFSESHSLYQRYQTTIHKDPPEKNVVRKYKRFLCSSPLQPWKVRGQEPGYGSFHQQYLLDGELIAVGVIDILPSCISSVYLYYDPKYSFLSLGTYSSLREVALLRELHRSCPTLKWYYMGYYIHSCPKMRYKGKYSPSYLLCPEKYSWHSIDDCISKLEASKYSRFSDESSTLAEDQLDYRRVLCLCDGMKMFYGEYQTARKKQMEEDIVEYCEMVGPRLAYKMLLCRNP